VEPKPEPPKPARPAKKPFADFPEIVSLPEVGGGPKPLGTVHLGEGEQCFIRLRGASRALKGDLVFDVRNADGGVSPRAWEVSVGKAEAEDGKLVARMKLDDQSQLLFVWDAEGAKLAAASHFRNCVLALTASGETHLVALRSAETVEAFAVDLTKTSVPKGEWKLADLPDPSTVQIAIENVEGAKYHVEPKPTMEADKGKAEVKIDDAGGMLSLKLDALLKKSGQAAHTLQVTVSPFIKLPESTKEVRYNRRMIDQNKQALEMQLQQFKMGQEMMAKMKVKPDPKMDPRGAERLRNMDAQVKLLEASLDQAKQFEETLDKLGGNLRLSFRVYYNADGTEVNLLTVGSPPAPEKKK
jgi:hypothetical protein